jgi:hypothetical protein
MMRSLLEPISCADSDVAVSDGQEAIDGIQWIPDTVVAVNDGQKLEPIHWIKTQMVTV